MKNLPIITRLTSAGLLSRTIIIYIAVYDYFFQLSGNKMDRYNKTAEEFSMSSKNVQRIIIKMNKET